MKIKNIKEVQISNDLYLKIEGNHIAIIQSSPLYGQNAVIYLEVDDIQDIVNAVNGRNIEDSILNNITFDDEKQLKKRGNSNE